MIIEMIVQDSETGVTHDISELLLETKWQTTMEGQPGKLTFSYVNDKDVTFKEGSVISFKANNKGVFFGYVFKRGKDKDEIITITAYDQMRYLKNKDACIIENSTASEAFSNLCKRFKLVSIVASPSSYKLAKRAYDGKTVFDIIQRGIDETLINIGEWYIIYDDFGVLTFNKLTALQTDITIGDNQLLRNYNFESSIDDDTYNQVKIIKDDTTPPEIVRDSESIARYGLLQYFEKVDEEANAAQIAARADMILKLKNRPTKKLKLPCLGDLKVRAGSSIVLEISDLAQEGIAVGQNFIITDCEHTFKSDLHFMELEVLLSI